MFYNLFQYSFIIRGLEAGLIVAVIAPLIGIFLVLRRYALIADTLSHVSLAGVALGLLLGINPIVTALGSTLAAAWGLETLRRSKRLYSESALALFMSGSLALAVVLLSWGHGFNANLFAYLFGSILTVTPLDIWVIAILAVIVLTTLTLFFKELLYLTFDEEAAQVSGLPGRKLNLVFIMLAALTVAISIPIVGVLLIAALIVIPAVTALQLKAGFIKTIVWAEIFSVISVSLGLLLAFYFNLASGGTIVLVMLAIFLLVIWLRRN